jgi:type 1 glutamine amidotransferase
MLIVEDRMNDPTAHLPATWHRYDHRTHPCGAVSVLIRLDESAHSDDTSGIWWHDGGAGRARYTGLGHTTESHSDTLFTRMPLGDIRVAVRAIPANQNRAGERQLIRRWEERECRT